VNFVQLTDIHNCLDSEALVTANTHIAKRLSVADYRLWYSAKLCQSDRALESQFSSVIKLDTKWQDTLFGLPVFRVNIYAYIFIDLKILGPS